MSQDPKKVILLGASGSIGRQTLSALEAFPEEFELVAASCHKDVSFLAALGSRRPGLALALSGSPEPLSALPPGTAYGEPGLLDLIRETQADIVVHGIAGSAGLAPSLAALESGKDLALANKESVVMAWALLERAAAANGARILPVDSEHAAVFQLCGQIRDIQEIIITASGGAFRDRPLEDLAGVKPDEAAAHPSWSMGRKISIDSATMANKGLEVIEASRLFGLGPERIKVLIHPQSMVHALVRGLDGSLYANISAPDMRLPILNALRFPKAGPSPFGRLDLAGKTLEFRAPEPRRYPLLDLAYKALASGYGATVSYNAADEVAVSAFEAGRIPYLGIPGLVQKVLESPWPRDFSSLNEVFACDREARALAEASLKEFR
jgi:1-deoxy-D-xylulose-5-phosphate reductoisomerase